MSRAVIFDIDGTMWDATEEIMIAWNQILDENGYEARDIETVRSCMGRPMDEVFRILLPNVKESEIKRMRRLCEKHEVDYLEGNGPEVYDGLEKALINLQADGFECFIVTNAQDGYTEAFLHRSMLGRYFKDYESFGRTGLQKADNIKMIVKRNGLDKAIYFGDTESDCRSSAEAGVQFVHARYGFGNGFEYKYSADSPEDLPEIAGRIFGKQ